MAITDKIGLLVIHGIGDQKPGFSNSLRDEVIDRLGRQWDRFVWQEVYWADVLEEPEGKLQTAMKAAKDADGAPIPLDWETIRRFIIHNFGDALAYHRTPGTGSAYLEVHERVSARIKELKDKLPTPESPVVVLAHSLGAHIMSNYLWDHQPPKPVDDGFQHLPTLTGMVTFGCNIPLFSLDFNKPRPIDLPDTRVTKQDLIDASRWHNFVDRDDVLGWPLRALYEMNPTLTQREKDTVGRIKDHEINVGGLLTSWNPAAHNGYWEDNDFTIPVANYLLELLVALDK